MTSRSAKIVLMFAVLLLLMFVFLASISAQELATRPVILTSSQAHGAVKFAVSQPLRDVATQVPSPVSFHEASPVLVPHLQQLTAAQNGPQPKDGALQTSVSSPVTAALGLNLLGVGTGFPGYSVPDAPSDVNLAVGDTQIVQWVNTSYAVFNKATGAVVQGPVLGNAFWSDFGGGCQNTNSGDIIILWDKVAHRWLAAQNDFTSPFLTCIAVSTTADATGTYYQYAFSQPGFPDYPKWGVWPDAYYQSQNNFGSAGSTFQGAYVCAYDRNKMLTGDATAEQICFQNGTFDDSLLPADLDSVNTMPPVGDPEVFLGSIDEGEVYQYLFHVDFTTPSNSTFTGSNGSMPISGVASYSLACGGYSACIPQEGITDLLDAVADRLMYRLAYRNFSDHQTWLVSHAVTAGSSVGERWYEFRAPENSTGLSVYQQGTFAPDSNYRWMGSLAMDSAQDIALGYSVSGSSMYPSISYTGRVPGDPLGTMEAEVSIITGSGSQSDTSNRWGDYTAMAIDAADDCTFWYTNQYYTATATFYWSTRLASFKFPNCGNPSASFSLAAAPGALSIVQASQGTSTITSTITGGYNNAINLSASGTPAGMTVTFNPSTLAAPGSGTSVMTVSVSGSTAAGTYPITVTGSDGTTQQSTVVTVTVTAVGSFTMSASPSTLTVVQGNQAMSTLTTTAVNGFNSSISLTAAGIPGGVTVTFSPGVIAAPGNGSSTIIFAVSGTTSQGTYPITFTGSGGGVQQSATITLTVNPPPSFSIHAQPPGLTIVQGSQGSTALTTSTTGGFNSSISLSATGLPTGVTASFGTNPIPAPGAGHSTLTFAVASNVPTGTYTITVTGNGGGLQASTTISLTVSAPSTYTISASPSSLSIPKGGSGTTTISTGATGGFNSSISLSASGLPTGVSASFNPATIAAPGSGSSTLSFAASSNAAAGTYSITVTGNGGGIQQSTTVTLAITVPSYTISAAPSSLSIAKGSNQGTTTITTAASGGFNSSISLQASGLPASSGVSFNPSTIAAPGSGSSTMTITLTSNTPAGTYPITVTANGGGIQHTTTVTLTVTTPSFTLSASPSSLSVLQGNRGTSTITTAGSGGFNSSIALSASGLPSGASASFNPSSIAAPGSGTSTLSIAVSSNTPVGTYPITVSAVGGGIQHTVTVTLTVTGTTTFTISATPSSQTVSRGSHVAYTVTLTSVGGFNSNVSLQVSGCPQHATCSFSPASLTPPGSSTLTVSTLSNTPTGTYTLTITGSSGNQQHSATVSLTVH